jgi:monoamine oxidase
MGFLIGGTLLESMKSLNEKKIISLLLNHLDTIYGGEANKTYINHFYKDWTKEPYILGGWTIVDDGSELIDDFRTLLKPLGNNAVFLAGEAIPHDEWSSTIPAAALSGQTAACRILNGSFTMESGCNFRSAPPESDANSMGLKPALTATWLWLGLAFASFYAAF